MFIIIIKTLTRLNTSWFKDMKAAPWIIKRYYNCKLRVNILKDSQVISGAPRRAMIELKGAREQIGWRWSEGNGRLNGGGALICKRWNFRERCDRACRTRNDRTAEKGGKERRTGKRRRCIPAGMPCAKERERERERERVISVIAPVYIVPLASNISRTAFVFDLLQWRRSCGRLARSLWSSSACENRGISSECAFPVFADKSMNCR